MRKKIIIIFIVMATIINIIIGSLIFLDIQVLQTPETTININIIEINSDEIRMQIIIDISNPNNFEIVTKNLEIVTTTPNGYNVASLLIEGGKIPSNGNKTYTTSTIVEFNGNSPEVLKTKISGVFGANIGFIQKTIPLSINIISSMNDIIKDIALPVLHIQTDLTEITQEGINITGKISAYNPNTFDISIGKLLVDVKTEKGRKVGNLTFKGGIITAKDSIKLNSTGRILLETFNSKKLMINMSGLVDVKLAGYNKSLPFNIEVEIKIPDVSTLLSDKSTVLSIKENSRITLQGLKTEIFLEINNTNKIDLLFEEIVCGIYVVDNDIKYLLGEIDDIQGGLVKAGTTQEFTGEIIIPFFDLFPSRKNFILYDWVLLSVRSNVTVSGVNQSISVEINGYRNLSLFA